MSDGWVDCGDDYWSKEGVGYIWRNRNTPSGLFLVPSRMKPWSFSPWDDPFTHKPAWTRTDAKAALERRAKRKKR